MSRAAAVEGGARTSPNIWNHPATYELENHAFDPGGVVESTIASLSPLDGAVVLDIGCGTGFHLARFVSRGAVVLGIEPFLPLALSARLRIASMEASAEISPGQAAVVVAGAESLPVADASVDVVLARWAYFFGPGCEPGLAEVERVLRPGGTAAFVDNDVTTSTFGGWFSRAHAAYDPLAVHRFWIRKGFQRTSLHLSWEFERREDFEAVVRIEFDAGSAETILAEHRSARVDYAVNLWWRHF